MKKIYKQPYTDIVRLNTKNSVLDGIVVINNSHEGTDEGLGKQTDGVVDDDDDDNVNYNAVQIDWSTE